MVIGSVILRGFKGLLNWQTQTETYFSKEISDRVRVVACLTTLPNIIHSDSTSETISIAEWQKVKKAIGATESDTVVIVWGNETDVNTAMKEIAIRAKEAAIGVPSETRQALKDGTTGFERILPGPERMYPDTDLPPKRITAERIKRIESQLPEYFWERVKWYKELKVPADLVEPLAISKLAGLFKKAVKEWKISPKLAAVTLIQYPKRLKKSGVKFEVIEESIFEQILAAHKDGLLAKEGILYAMQESVKTGGFKPETHPQPVQEKEVKNFVKNSFAELNGRKIYNEEQIDYILKGAVMNKLRGRIDGRIVSENVNVFVKEGI